jgi:DNA polymerase III subunit epsilon
MGLLKEEVFVCVDCESTGLDAEQDAIIEVGAVRFTCDAILDQMETLVDPDRPIPPESTQIHHISDAMVAGKPKIGEVLPSLLAFLDRAVIVGHGIAFDLRLLQNAADRAKIVCNLANRKQIDTLRLARLYGDSPSNSLEVLRRHFLIPPEQAHRALDDAMINMKVFLRLVQRYRTLEQVIDALAKPVQLKKMPLGKHKGRLFSEIPLDYLRWAVRQDFDDDLLFSIREELRTRKAGKGFHLSSNPFQQL